jgi:hypothetical protein
MVKMGVILGDPHVDPIRRRLFWRRGPHHLPERRSSWWLTKMHCRAQGQLFRVSRLMGVLNKRVEPEITMESEEGIKWFTLKLLIMVVLISVDMGLNSSLEYDLYTQNTDLQLIMFG